MSEKSIAVAAADAAVEIVKTPEAYKDALKPAAKEFGTSLAPSGRHLGEGISTLARAVNAAMSCLKPLIWCFEQVEEIIQRKVEEEFKEKPERLITPDPMVAVPAIQALQYSAQSPTLREMYLNLLARSMDKETAATAHPAFVETIKQLTPDEAKIVVALKRAYRIPTVSLRVTFRGPMAGGGMTAMESFSHIPMIAKCDCPDLIASNLDNICRLRLAAHSPIGMQLAGSKAYEPLVDDPLFSLPKKALEDAGQRTEVWKGYIEITSFGSLFCAACLPKEENEILPSWSMEAVSVQNTDAMPRAQ